MTAKEYLQQAYIIDSQINIMLAKAAKLRSSLYWRSISTGDFGNSQPSRDAMGRTIANVADYEAEADKLVDNLVEKRLEIERTIQAVQDKNQREVLERRYLLFQPWDGYYDKVGLEYVKGIWEHMHYSRRRVFDIHKAALNCIELHLKNMI